MQKNSLLDRYQQLINKKTEQVNIDRRFTYNWKQSELKLMPLLEQHQDNLEICIQFQSQCNIFHVKSFYSYFIVYGAFQLRKKHQSQFDFLSQQTQQIKNGTSMFFKIKNLIEKRQSLLQQCKIQHSQTNLTNLRNFTVEVVNLIGKWIDKVDPDHHSNEHIIFIYNEVNYLFKMLTDFSIPEEIARFYQEYPNPLLIPYEPKQIGIEQKDIEIALQLLATQKSMQLKDILEGRPYIFKISYPEIQSKKKQKTVEHQESHSKPIKTKSFSLKNLIKQNQLEIFRSILDQYKRKTNIKTSPISAKNSCSKIPIKQCLPSSSNKIAKLKLQVTKHQVPILSRKNEHNRKSNQQQKPVILEICQQPINLPSIKPDKHLNKSSNAQKNKRQQMREDQQIVQNKLAQLLKRKSKLQQFSFEIKNQRSPQKLYALAKMEKIVEIAQSKKALIKKVKETAQSQKKYRDLSISHLKTQRQTLQKQLLLQQNTIRRLEKEKQQNKHEHEHDNNESENQQYKQKFQQEKAGILQQRKEIEQRISQHQQIFRKMKNERKRLQVIKEKSKESQIIEDIKKRNAQLEILIQEKKKQRIENNRLEELEKNKISILQKQVKSLQKKELQLLTLIQENNKSNQIKSQLSKQSKQKQRIAFEEQQLKILSQYEQKNNKLYQLFEKIKNRNELIKAHNSQLYNEINNRFQNSKDSQQPYSIQQSFKQPAQATEEEKFCRLQRIQQQLKKYLTEKNTTDFK